MSSLLKSAAKTIKRDVCIIGGGAAGTYAALRLRDAGKSVVIVEKSSKLGGGNRGTPNPTLLRDSKITRKLYSRFNIDLKRQKFAYFSDKAKTFKIIDFEKGEIVSPEKYDADGMPLPAKLRGSFEGSITPEALKSWQDQIPFYKVDELSLTRKRAKNEPKVKPTIHIKDQAYGKTVTGQYRNVIASMAYNFCRGYGDLYKLPMINVVRNFGPTTLRALEEGFLMPEDVNNEKLYRLAQHELKNDILFNFTPVQSEETGGRIVIDVKRRYSPQDSGEPDEKNTATIEADTCFFTIPPSKENLAWLDLALYQQRILHGFKFTGWYTMKVSNTRLRDDIHFYGGTTFGVKEHVRSGQKKSHKPWQAIYDIRPTGVPGTFQLDFGFDGYLNLDRERTLEYIVTALRRLWTKSVRQELFLPGTVADDIQPVFDDMELHHPYGARLSDKVNESYDYRWDEMMKNHIETLPHVVFGGAAFSRSHDASLIWENTEQLLDRLLKPKIQPWQRPSEEEI
ncbi:hypothetical protein QBC38DRAFT_54825 [Podospora fimiseda]|uniref:Uncharacterized protein n=1 Tax=Podospora fimiseda TaxID=252190 RepID=A0AAN7BH43_9PEZI|nr:hypothetical protein QBC38DRAFT_54825 [Podospora fimiseda]